DQTLSRREREQKGSAVATSSSMYVRMESGVPAITLNPALRLRYTLAHGIGILAEVQCDHGCFCAQCHVILTSATAGRMAPGSGECLRTTGLGLLPALAVGAGDVHHPDLWFHRPTQNHHAHARANGYQCPLDRTGPWPSAR